MTREELKKIVEGITDEQLKSILDINTADIGKAKKNVEELEGKIKTLEEGNGKLTKQVNDLIEKSNSNTDYKSELEKLQKEIKEKEDADKKAKADAELTDAITAVTVYFEIF